MIQKMMIMKFSIRLMMILVVRMTMGWTTKLMIIKFIALKRLCRFLMSVFFICSVCIELNVMYD